MRYFCGRNSLCEILLVLAGFGQALVWRDSQAVSLSLCLVFELLVLLGVTALESRLERDRVSLLTRLDSVEFNMAQGLVIEHAEKVHKFVFVSICLFVLPVGFKARLWMDSIHCLTKPADGTTNTKALFNLVLQTLALLQAGGSLWTLRRNCGQFLGAHQQIQFKPSEAG